jgi:transposase
MVAINGIPLLSGARATLSKGWLHRLFKNFGWSCRTQTVVNWNKYTAENIAYYDTYMRLVQYIPWLHLKFLDETHFDPVDCTRRRTYGLTGTATRVPTAYPLGQRYSVTIMLSLTPDDHGGPVFFDLFNHTNTAMDFLRFLRFLVEGNHLQRGDILILDNATVHNAEEMLIEATTLLAENGIRMRFLPTYSPELNPVELVNAAVKSRLRGYFRGGVFWKEIVRQLSRITYAEVLKYYSRCLDVTRL